MAKKSAKSKGYRKQNGKKPYLSKRDIVLLCLLVAAVVVAAVLLFRYDDGALKVKDGAVVTEGDNWLIVNGSNTRGGQRYYKLGEVGELEGYERKAEPTLANANVTEYVFTAEDAPIKTVTVSTSHASAQALSRYTAGTLSELKGTEVSDVQSAQMGGREVQYFTYTAAPSEEAEKADDATEEGAEEPEEASDESPYHSAILGYIDAGHDSCVIARLEGGADTAEACPDEAALLEALEKALGVVTLEES